jgi:tRNA A-37 threonylcarbamoyl transferase component Bud32
MTANYVRVESSLLIGRGTQAKVFVSHELAYKGGKIGQHERQIQQEAYRLGLAPEVFEDYGWALSMEYVQGTKRPKSGGLRSYEFIWLCFALTKLAVAGYAHCDLVLGNILLRPNQLPMLIDFGAAKHLAEQEDKLSELRRVARNAKDYCKTKAAKKLSEAILSCRSTEDIAYQLALAVSTLPKGQQYLFDNLTFN